MSAALVVLLAYLIGSIPFAVLVSRAFRLPDPRSYGSHNPGATNVLRSGKKSAAVLTLLGDVAKGWIAVAIAQTYAPPVHPSWAIAGAALAVFLGHLFPLFLRFKGGKGVATAGGVLFAFSVWLGLAAMFTWLVAMSLFRVSAVAALAAATTAPMFAFGLFGFHVYSISVLVICALLVWRHKANIEHLRAQCSRYFQRIAGR